MNAHIMRPNRFRASCDTVQVKDNLFEIKTKTRHNNDTTTTTTRQSRDFFCNKFVFLYTHIHINSYNTVVVVVSCFCCDFRTSYLWLVLYEKITWAHPWLELFLRGCASIILKRMRQFWSYLGRIRVKSGDSREISWILENSREIWWFYEISREKSI